MTQFNYVTSDGKILKIDSEKLSDENKNKLSDFIKKDYVLKQNLAQE